MPRLSQHTIGLLCLVVTAVSSCSRRETPPNIVLIYADDLGWRDLGVMGSDYYQTPHIDALADAGMRFTNAYANAPNCAPSRASLISGQYTPRHGIYTVASAARGIAEQRRLIPVENETTLDLDVTTIAEALRATGYTTAHFGKWHLGGEGTLPTDQGFDVNVGGDEFGSPATHFFPYGNDRRTVPGLDGGTAGEYLTDRLTDEAIAFVSDNATRPFFLYLAHYAVHTPIQAKDVDVDRFRSVDGVGGQANPTYAAMIAALDEGVGKILDTLDQLDIADRTVVIFMSDNGGFGPVTSMAPLRGSKGMLYEGGIRVPMVVRWPGVTAPGVVSDVPVIGTDLFPTFLDIAGADPPSGQPLDGVSLLSLLRGGVTPDERPLFWHFPAYLARDRSVAGPWRTTPASAVRVGDFKLVHFFEGDVWELYNLSDDLGEDANLIDREPERAATLRSVLETWWEATGAWLPTETNPSYDPKTLNGR
jgi:arylsulfatase A-like enzyme